jgi:hypothetical protein
MLELVGAVREELDVVSPERFGMAGSGRRSAVKD